jgi:ribonuclease J
LRGSPSAARAEAGRGRHVIFSSKQIPGNEIAIGRIMNALSDLGVEIVTESQAHVHVSGHPGRPELAAMYDWIRPQILVPVHGEPRHMPSRRASRWSMAFRSRSFQTNGDIVRLAPGEPRKIGEIGSAGWSSTATSSFPPMERPSTSEGGSASAA